ncbi:hypothetical protein HWV62_7944 [Athelia sp. TMB]|nr:hypothetical protein HWV62_7944 [Athelia sp. TMB]
MDVFYDILAAQEAIKKIVTARSTGKASTMQLAKYADALPDNISTITTDIPMALRLIERRETGEDYEEIVFRVQGALSFTQLPPIRSKTTLPDKGDARYMKQSVRLTGLGDKQFHGAIDGLVNIATFMGQNLERGEVEGWAPARFRCWEAIEASNRYFVHQNSEGDMVSVPLSAGVDPDGVLATIAGEEWVHTEDNTVSYYRASTDGEGKQKYETIKPGEFRLGDLVEAQISAIAVKRRVRGDVYSMKLVLRALTMLDDGYSRAARTNRMKQAARKPTSSVIVMKRSVGYLEDEGDRDEVPTNKMKRLSVNEAGASTGDHQVMMEDSHWKSS